MLSNRRNIMISKWIGSGNEMTKEIGEHQIETVIAMIENVIAIVAAIDQGKCVFIKYLMFPKAILKNITL